LGFICILASVSIDSWTHNSFPVGKFGDATPATVGGMKQSWGTLGLTYSGRTGYGYKLLCPAASQNNLTKGYHQIGDKAKELNRTSIGMIFMLIVANAFGFVASFLAVLPASGSPMVQTLKHSKILSIVAAVLVLITWALWLRAEYEYLRPNNLIDSCRFPCAPGISINVSTSFGLAIVSTFLYILLFVHVNKVISVYGESEPLKQNGSTVIYAVCAFTALFTGTLYNEWSHGGMYKFGEYYSTIWQGAAQDAFLSKSGIPSSTDWQAGFGIIQRPVSNGLAHVTYSNSFGVYTAFEKISINMPYADIQNRAFFCIYDMETDGAGQGLVQGGRVTLGFGITAVIFSAIAAVLQSVPHPKAFYLSCVAFCSGVVCLLVWGITTDFLIRWRCCITSNCVLGQSYGLMAAGVFFLLMSIFYQGWVIADDVYVLHPTQGYSAKPGLEENLGSNQI